MKKKQPDIILRFSGSAEVNVYADGQAVVHTAYAKGHAVEKVISVRGGPITTNTLPALEVRALLGPCTITITGKKAQTLKTGKTLKVPNGATFTLKATAAVLLCKPLPGPGLVQPWPGGGGLP